MSDRRRIASFYAVVNPMGMTTFGRSEHLAVPLPMVSFLSNVLADTQLPAMSHHHGTSKPAVSPALYLGYRRRVPLRPRP
jgi:hypothetical protein